MPADPILLAANIPDVPRWVAAREVVLFDALQTMICRAVCSWAGVPLDPWDVDLRTIGPTSPE